MNCLSSLLATAAILMTSHSLAYSPPSSNQCVLILEHYRNWIFVPNGDTSNQRAVWQHVTEDGQLDPKGFLYWFPPAAVWSVGWDPHEPVESHRYGYISAGKSSICPDDGLSGFFWIDGKHELVSHLHQALPRSWTTCLPQDGRLTGSGLTPVSVGQTNSLVECARAALEANKRTTGVQWQRDTKACSGTIAKDAAVGPGDGSDACLLTLVLLPGKAIGGGMGTFDLKLVKESVAKAEDCGSHVSAAESDADGMSYDEETKMCYAAFNMTSVNVKATGGKWRSAFLVQGIHVPHVSTTTTTTTTTSTTTTATTSTTAATTSSTAAATTSTTTTATTSTTAATTSSTAAATTSTTTTTTTVITSQFTTHPTTTTATIPITTTTRMLPTTTARATSTTIPHTTTTTKRPVVPASSYTGVIIGASVGGVFALLLASWGAYAAFAAASAEQAPAAIDVQEAEPGGEVPESRDIQASFNLGGFS